MYKIIDVVKTGEKIKQELNEKEITVREVQEILHLNAQQSIYRWFRGETLPSIDNLYTIAYLLRLPMEALIVTHDRQMSEEHIADIVHWAGAEAVESEKIRKAYWEVLGVLMLRK